MPRLLAALAVGAIGCSGCSDPTFAEPWAPDCTVELSPEASLREATDKAAWRWSVALAPVGVSVVLSDDGAPVLWASDATVQALASEAPLDEWSDPDAPALGVTSTKLWADRVQLDQILFSREQAGELQGNLVSAVLHEIGHGLGLKHVDPKSGSVMAHGTRGDLDAYPTAGDVQRVQALPYWQWCGEALDAGPAWP